MKEKTCKQRIKNELKKEIDRLNDAAIVSNMIEKNAQDETLEEYAENCLAFDKETWVKITMSTGGPADGWRVRIDNGEIDQIYYWFQDWFDYAEVKLTDQQFDDVKGWLGQAFYFGD